MDEFSAFRSGVEAGVEYLRRRLARIPQTAVLLGTGLGSCAELLDEPVVVPYRDIPGFPAATTVVSHAGNLIYGRIGGKDVVFLQGRFHHYEGYSARVLTTPVRVLSLLGIRQLIVTNAAGGLNPQFQIGDIMMIRDHINLIGDNPLRGENVDEWGPRFPDMSHVYDKKLRDVCRSVSSDLMLGNVTEGVYCAIPGPSLETPAETRYLRQCGADAVGMSTVPEVIVARHGGMEVLGLSVIANVNDPENLQPVSVDEILVAMNTAATDLGRLLGGVLGSN